MHVYRRFISLIESESVMVIATLDKVAKLPWTAAVYFFYNRGGFYFFSSPKSIHITQAMKSEVAAISIFSASECWSDIQGVQMFGEIKGVNSLYLIKKITKKYLSKFSSYNDLFSLFWKKPVKVNDFFKNFGVKLYSFKPSKMVYSDNRLGFGLKEEISLSILLK